MTHNIDIVDGCDLSKKVYSDYLPKKTNVLLIHSEKPFSSCTLLIRWSHLVTKWAFHVGTWNETFKRRLLANTRILA